MKQLLINLRDLHASGGRFKATHICSWCISHFYMLESKHVIWRRWFSLIVMSRSGPSGCEAFESCFSWRLRLLQAHWPWCLCWYSLWIQLCTILSLHLRTSALRRNNFSGCLIMCCWGTWCHHLGVWLEGIFKLGLTHISIVLTLWIIFSSSPHRSVHFLGHFMHWDVTITSAFRLIFCDWRLHCSSDCVTGCRLQMRQ
jgi:hypothetical protein